MSWARFSFLVMLAIATLLLGYPAAFIATHGLEPQGWPALDGTARNWFFPPGRDVWTAASSGLMQVAKTYTRMALGQSSAFAGGGRNEFLVVFGSALFLGVIVALGSKLEQLRHRTTRFGDARFASRQALARMRAGIEIGLDPVTRLPVRLQVEGNLLTIAPPRRGKTGGLILPNLAFPDPEAWSGPAVVIDPKGDAYRAARRRRSEMGRKIRCIDPLNLVGGTDRWNPLMRRKPGDVLYLLAMALALLPAADTTTESGAFFRDRASVILVAAILVCIRDGRNDIVLAAALVRAPEQLLAALEGRDDAISCDARSILTGDERSRSNILATAGQGLSWLLDRMMQEAVQDHTFSITDLCAGETDLFIVLPADERKTIIAPYIRWLLADLFGAARERPVVERIIVFLDEAFILGAFSAIVEGAGELPGYGISLWSYWQSEAQLSRTFGPDGAAILRDTAEVIQLFNLSRANAEECRRWSDALGTYTGIDETETVDATTGRPTNTRGAAAVPLVHPADMAAATQDHSLVFINSPAYTADPLKLAKTAAHRDPRFAALLDMVAPIGVTGSGRR